MQQSTYLRIIYDSAGQPFYPSMTEGEIVYVVKEDKLYVTHQGKPMLVSNRGQALLDAIDKINDVPLKTSTKPSESLTEQINSLCDGLERYLDMQDPFNLHKPE